MEKGIDWNGRKIFCTFRSVKNCKRGQSDRFCYRLGFEWLNIKMPRMTKLDAPTTGPPMFTLTSCVGYIHRITAKLIHCGRNTKH